MSRPTSPIDYLRKLPAQFCDVIFCNCAIFQADWFLNRGAADGDQIGEIRTRPKSTAVSEGVTDQSAAMKEDELAASLHRFDLRVQPKLS